jgi:tetratricopeptide (TPR) repeat protein
MNRRRRRDAKGGGNERLPSPASTGATPQAPARALRPARRWLFRGVVLAIPWLFLLALELVLRAAGYGVPMDFVLRREVTGELRYLSNPTFTWLFFAPSLARLYPPFSLAVRKPPNTCRVFVLGSSAAEGDPEPGFGIARMLEVLLRDQYPGVEFEVVNAAATAVNSHVVYRVARACTELEPDLFVLYTGNNEVVGPYGAGTVLTSAAPNVSLVRAGIEFRATRVGQAVSAVVGATLRRAAGQRTRGSWGGMEMFLERQLCASDPLLERSYGNFGQNLGDTLAAARRAGVPVVVSTIAVNLRACAPFASRHGSALSGATLRQWEMLYGEGVRLQDAGRSEEATERFLKAAEIDAGHAELQYRLGRCSWTLGRYADAKQRYLRALELDTLRFRADRRINDTIRGVAARAGSGVHLVDAAQQIEAQTPHGVPGEESFLDHVHPTFAGNYLLSVALLGGIQEALPAVVRSRRAARPILGEQECARRLVYTELDRYVLAETLLQRLRQPPFTAQMDHAEQVERFSRELAELRSHGESGAVDAAVKAYEDALSTSQVHWSVRERYARIAKRIGNASGAEREWRRLTEELPQDPGLRLQLARAQREAGRYVQAEASLRAVLEYQPESPVALAELARVALLLGRSREAVTTARRAVALDPRDANARYVLATSLCRAQTCSFAERAQAIAELEQALEIAPDSPAVRRDLARALARQGQDLAARAEAARAVPLLERALEIEPGMAEVHEELGLLYQRLNDREKAVWHLSAALQADPRRERARRALESLKQQ